MNSSTATLRPLWQRSIVMLSIVVLLAVLLFTTYWLRSVLIPITVAAFFTTVLSPAVAKLQSRGVPRLPSVILVLLIAFSIAGSISFVIAYEVSSMSEMIADRSAHIKAKMDHYRGMVVGNGESRWSKLINDIESTVRSTHSGPAAQKVVIESETPAWTGYLETIVGPATDFFGFAAFAFVLTVFMLLTKDDIQDRFLRLVGQGTVTTATRALKDANTRVSSYLFSQMILNMAFGIVCSIGLLLLGVQYAILWGFIAFIMRYVPYIGTWIGVIPPIIFSFAVSEGIWQPVSIFVLFIALEMFSNNVIEPRLYGSALGVSEVALLVSAAFWSYMWGPVGLILSGPITTCLVVLGKHLPMFEPLYILLGTEPSLTPEMKLYQRISAGRDDEADQVLESESKLHGIDHVVDNILIPTIRLFKQSKLDGGMTAEEEVRVLVMFEEVVDSWYSSHEDEILKDSDQEGERIRLLAYPASDAWDQLSLKVLLGLMSPLRWEVKLIGTQRLASELLSDAVAFEPHAIVVGSMPPNGLTHLRYTCKRLRNKFADVHLILGRWSDPDVPLIATQTAQLNLSAIETQVTQVRNHLQGWLPIFEKSHMKELATQS